MVFRKTGLGKPEERFVFFKEIFVIVAIFCGTGPLTGCLSLPDDM
jgi:hypothetical protein